MFVTDGSRNYAERKGYSGTAVFTKEKPLTVSFGIELDVPDNEGRVITLEYDEFYLVNVYTPNSKRDLTRLRWCGMMVARWT
jgi:exodeoxyribonuclease-3